MLCRENKNPIQICMRSWWITLTLFVHPIDMYFVLRFTITLRMEPCLFIYDMNWLVTKNPATPVFTGLSKTPRVGLEPTTTRLTAECSTIELSRIILFLPSFSSVCDRDVALPLSYRGSLFFLFPMYLQNCIQEISFSFHPSCLSPLWSCPRPISCGQLHTLLHFHLRPIYLVVFKGSYNLRWDISSWGGLHA